MAFQLRRKSREAIGAGSANVNSEDFSEIDAMAVAQPVAAAHQRGNLSGRSIQARTIARSCDHFAQTS
jgi:hypothetical protein